VLPDGAADTPTAENLQAMGLQVSRAPATDNRVYRVTVNPVQCNSDPASCVFLDSQKAIEEQAGAGISATEALVTCPFVIYRDMPLKP